MTAALLTYNNRTRTAELFNTLGGQKVEFTGPHTADVIDGKITGAFVTSLRRISSTAFEPDSEPETSPRRVLATALAQAAVMESLKTKMPASV